ncbi:hypothetical protein ACP275_06G161000 [Erythranthe tilingii]
MNQKNYTTLTQESIRQLRNNEKFGVDGEAVGLLLPEQEDKDDFLQSYVAAHGNIKWCPNPACDRAVQIDSQLADETKNYDVVCDCLHAFCWNCTEEIHRPVDCKTVDKWNKLNSYGPENTTWIMSFTKPCPNCGTNIEKDKNPGCNRMTCPSPCGFEFCWLCLNPWNNNSGHASCRDYYKSYTRSSLMQWHANLYGKYTLNHNSRETALDTLRRFKKNKLPSSEIKALELIVESRRVLKWSYAYLHAMGFTYNAAPGNRGLILKVLYLLCLQEILDFSLTELQKYYCDSDNNQSKKRKYTSAKLVELADKTRGRFEELVRVLENDVCEAEVPSFSELIRGERKQVLKNVCVVLGCCVGVGLCNIIGVFIVAGYASFEAIKFTSRFLCNR